MGQARQTVERLQLGLTLQRLRLAAGKSQQEAADLIGRSAGRLSQVENGKGALGTIELTSLLDFYGVHGAERNTVLALGNASRRRQPRLGYADTLPDSYPRFMDLLSAAQRIGWYESGIMPGLVQGPAYIDALMGLDSFIRSEAEITERIAFRLDLQRRVLESGNAKEIDIVFTEESLLRVVGDASVMREQVLHLLQLIEQHDRLSIRIVPLSAGNNPALGGGMVILDFENANPISFAPTLYGPATYYDQPTDTGTMIKLFARVREVALSPADSRSAMITFLARSS